MTKSPSSGNVEGEVILDDWKIIEEYDGGNHGTVFEGEHVREEVDRKVACKFMAIEDLHDGWKKEVEKASVSERHPNVVSIIDFGQKEIDGTEYACIVYEFVDGSSLRDYIYNKLDRITVPFVIAVIGDILEVMHGLEHWGIEHNDLHAGNILLSEAEYVTGDDPIVQVTDFGIGGTHNDLQPKDDFAQLGNIGLELLDTIDEEELNSSDRAKYDYLIEVFIEKFVFETNPIKGEFVRSPEKLKNILEEIDTRAESYGDDEGTNRLQKPFDYLSCEQMGDSFDLISRLYSKNFPGHGQVQGKSNSIITGPRGCGKTTILKNMSSVTRVESRSVTSLGELDYLGIYYPCRDLYFAFHYVGDNPSDIDRELMMHYFSLSLLDEFLETIQTLRRDLGARIPEGGLAEFEDKISNELTQYSKPPEGTDTIHHIQSIVNSEKNEVGSILRKRPQYREVPDSALPPDFLTQVSRDLVDSTSWGSDLPIFFLIDDYSMPKISEGIQSTLNDIVMERWERVYFKISTESITSFHPYFQSGKLVEERREYEVVDLAAHFIRDKDNRADFLEEVLNTRLEFASDIHGDYSDIREILGQKSYHYTDLARKIRSDEDVDYAGFEIIRDIFSGDISEILRLISGMFEEEGDRDDWEEGLVDLPIPESTQDEVIQEYGGSFINKIDSVPDKGNQLRKIAEEFAKHCHEIMLTQNSSNQENDPPRQVFRIELADPLKFESGSEFVETLQLLRRDGQQIGQEELVEEAEEIYNALLRYGIFLLDQRGKSIRGNVVQRLYLRRLLIPKYNLTPSQRDNVMMERSEFLYLLKNPEEYRTADFEQSQNRTLGSFEQTEDVDGGQ